MTDELVPGAILGGRYRLERVLAEGGMGMLWIAQRVEDGGTVSTRSAKVAIKLLKGEGTDATLRRRLLREARAAAAVGHPNIVTVHEVIELDDGAPALVMDLLEGESLRARLDRERTLPVCDAVGLLLPIAAAVESAHAVGIVHRDLKPENVFLVRGADGAVTVKVLDFGIAKFTAEGGGAARTAALTHTGVMLGTPYYMAPEQILGEEIDGRTDVWALGVILHECLSGRRPIEEENVGRVLRRVLTGAIRPLHETAPSLPEALCQLVDRMLSFDRAGRPPDIAAVRAALEPFAGSTLRVPRSATGRPPAFGDSPTERAPAMLAPAADRAETLSRAEITAPAPSDARDATTAPAVVRRSRSRRWLLGGVGVTLATAAAAGALWRRADLQSNAAPSLPDEVQTSPRCPAGMALVAGGELMMGSEDGADDERPVHRVRVGDVCLDRTEVTVPAYLACVGRGGCRPPSISVSYGGLSDADRALESGTCNASQAASKQGVPINCVSFSQATAYCAALGKRLPTEEEWEYAARGGAEQRTYPWGSEPPGPRLLNACGAECAAYFGKLGQPMSSLYPGDDGFPLAAPVGRFPAGDSRDGLHDMSGNVGEWTASPYCAYPDHACKSPYRVFRGGSFATELLPFVRSTGRLYSNPEHRYMQVGFRCARDAAPAAG